MSDPESGKSKTTEGQASSSSSSSSNQSYPQFLINEATRIARVSQEDRIKNATLDRVSGQRRKKTYSSGQCAACGEALSPGHGHT